MTNGQINKAFLSKLTPQAKDLILTSIAKHYRVSKQEIYNEVTNSEAEHLLEYMVGGERSATSMLMQKLGFRKVA